MRAICFFKKEHDDKDANISTAATCRLCRSQTHRRDIKRKQSLRAVLRTLIKIYTFAPNFKFGTK